MGIFEIKNFKTFLFWALIILIFSFVGFIIYIVFGNALKIKAKGQLKNKYKSTKKYISQTNWYNNYKQTPQQSTPIAKFVQKYNVSIWNNKKVSVFVDGKSFANDLIMEITKAKHNINMEFYIFADDEIGNEIGNLLIKKAKQGVQVNLLYDDFGSKKTKLSFWEKLREGGVNVASFFPGIFNLPMINLKINYRNHRKIVVIDGKIAYSGGVNIRDDHMGKNKKLNPWRDTIIKIEGCGAYPLQDIFLNDFLFANHSQISQKQIENFFPKIQCSQTPLQVLESTPCKDTSQIYQTYLKIINSCSKYLYIQTPYFVVKNKMIEAIIDAKNRGVKVSIFIPKIPDSKLVYGASLLSLKKLVKNNIDVYLYKNFIHSKTLLTEQVASIGTCNFDNRSFFLNFENTCLLYSKPFINKQLQIMQNDINHSTILTKKKYNKLKIKNIFTIIIYKIIHNFL